jgi:hypothetical protein
VIDLYGYANAPAVRDFLGGLFDSTGDFVDRRRTAADGTAGDINSSVLFTKRHRDASPATSAGSGDDCDFAIQPARHKVQRYIGEMLETNAAGSTESISGRAHCGLPNLASLYIAIYCAVD